MWKYYDEEECHKPAEFVKCQMRSEQDHNATVLDCGPFQILSKYHLLEVKSLELGTSDDEELRQYGHDAQHDTVFSVTETPK
jgi:hypothetical protein